MTRRVRNAIIVVALAVAATAVVAISPGISGATEGSGIRAGTVTSSPPPGTPLLDKMATPATGCAGGSGPYWWANLWGSANHGPGYQDVRRVMEVSGVNNGLSAHLWTWNGMDRQYWCMYLAYRDLADGLNVYNLVSYISYLSVTPNMCLDVEGPSRANGAKVHQWDCNGWIDPRSQQWKQIPMGYGSVKVDPYVRTYEFKNMYSGRCLDLTAYGVDDGTPFQQWDCKTNPDDILTTNQLFY